MIADATAYTRIRLGVPADEYHRREMGVMTSGAIKAALRSPAHYRCWLASPDRDTDALRLGRLIHFALDAGLDAYIAKVAVEPTFGDCRRKGPKADRDAWRERNAAKEWVSAADHRTVCGVVSSLWLHPEIGRLLNAPAVCEATIEWEDDETGLPCKCRPDRWHRDLGLILDFKTTTEGKAAPDRFGYVARDLGYDLSAAHYLAGADAVGEPSTWLWAAVEKEPPFACALYEITSDQLEAARDIRRRVLQQIADCIEADVWPAYPTGIQTLTIRRANR